MGKVLILISGSDEKSVTQETAFQNKSLVDCFSPRIRKQLFETRRNVKNLIQSGRVYDFRVKDENRRERESNRLLLLGPDFNGNEKKPVYLPAYKRYHGSVSFHLNSDHS